MDESEIIKLKKRQNKKNATNNRIVPNHAYAVIDVFKKGTVQMLELRNPWGHFNDTEGNNVSSSNGCFKIPYNDWCCLFNSVYLCVLQEYEIESRRDVLSVYKSTLQSRWTLDNAGGCSQFPNWRLNPTFTLRIENPEIETIYLTLSQADKRSNRKKAQALNEFEKLNYENKIGMEVVQLKENTFGPEVVNGKYDIVAKSSFWNKRDVSIAFDVKPGMTKKDLIVIPSTYFAGKVGSFSLSVQIDANTKNTGEKNFTLERRIFGESGDVQLELNDTEDGIKVGANECSAAKQSARCSSFNYSYRFCDKWGENTSGGPPHGQFFHKNPQYQVYVQSKTTLIMLLCQQYSEDTKTKKNKDHPKKIGIGLSAYHQIECLNNFDAVEKLAAQEKFQVGKPCLMKVFELSKSVEVTPEQNPILLVACCQKNGKSKFVLNVLSDQPISIRRAPPVPSKKQQALIEKEVELNIESESKGGKGKKKHNSSKPKKTSSSIRRNGPSFNAAKNRMNVMGDLYGSLA